MGEAFKRGAMVGLLLGLPCAVGAQPLERPTWTNPQVPYYVNPVNTDVSPAAAIAAVQAGALTWSAQSEADFTFFYAGETNGTSTTYNLKNEVIFRNATEGDAIATAYTWSYQGAIVDSDIIFWDGAYEYFTGSTGCVGGFFLEDIAAHEFGHAAGIGHSEAPGSSMLATVSYCSTDARTLEPDDRDQIEGLYPSDGATPPPASPVGLTASPSWGRMASSVDLLWTDMSADEDMFVVERSTDGLEFVAIGQTPADVTSFVDRPLHPDTTYWYRVVAWSAGIRRGQSNMAPVQTTPGPPPPEAASRPFPVDHSVVGGTYAVLRWQPGAGSLGFDVYFGTTDPPPLFARDLPSTALPVPGLAPNTTYYWSVFATNESGSSSAERWQFTTGETTPHAIEVPFGSEKGLDYSGDKVYQP